MSEARLRAQRARWMDKASLRAIYEDFYGRIQLHLAPGPVLEIGAGSGNMRDYVKDCVATDLVPAPWLDAAADAQALPFANECFRNVVGVDVLHHIERPSRFFREVQRVLGPDGRLLLIEPWISSVSRFFYRYFHAEPLDLTADPLGDGALGADRDPFDANQAAPTLIFGRHRHRFTEMFPHLRIARVEPLSLIAYPLSGGFRRWTLLPRATVAPLLRLETSVMRFVGGFAAFRALIVLEKVEASSAP